jgi:CHASE3 domain sensor protein
VTAASARSIAPEASTTRLVPRLLSGLGFDQLETPTVLRAWRSALVVLCVLFAVVGALGVQRRADALQRVDTAAQQLIAVQDLRVAAVSADSIASTAFLVGGDDLVARAAYDEQIRQAQAGLVRVAADVNSADAESLAGASERLSVYARLVEQAEANNRQGFPVAAAYLRQARSVLGGDVVPALRGVEQRQRDEINQQLASANRAGAWLHLVGWPLLAVLGAAMWWLARRFRRLVNAPLAAATALVLVALVAAASSQGGAMGDVDAAIGGALARADRVAQARGAAFDARANEALTLINRGNGAADEAAWATATTYVRDSLSGEPCTDVCLVDRYQQYAVEHVALRGLDDGGLWDAAVVAAREGPLVEAFSRFDTDSAAVVSEQIAVAAPVLADAHDRLSMPRWLVIVAGLAAAALAVAGCNQRLREYR